MEKAKNVIEIKVCVDGMDELKKFIKKMEQEYGSMENPDIMPSSLEDMNVGQLQKLARANGLEPPKNAKKQELISALRGE